MVNSPTAVIELQHTPLGCAQTSNARRRYQEHRRVSSKTLLLGSDTNLAGKTAQFVSDTDYCKHL